MQNFHMLFENAAKDNGIVNICYKADVEAKLRHSEESKVPVLAVPRAKDSQRNACVDCLKMERRGDGKEVIGR
jgi:hypothetical protein